MGRFVGSLCLSALLAPAACSEALGPERAADPPATASATQPVRQAETPDSPAAPPDTMPPAKEGKEGKAAKEGKDGKGLPPLSAQECAQLGDEVSRQIDQKRFQPLHQLLQEGIVRCPKQRGLFIVGLGWIEMTTDNHAAAASHFIGVVMAPNPPRLAFEGLAKVYRLLDGDGQRAVRELGQNPAAPIYVPDIGTEVYWVETFGCSRGRANVKQLSPISDDKRFMTRVHFACPDGTEHILHFDHTADAALKKQKKPAPASASK
jgi:hypothetical protein